jgi:hypothetical protein
MTTDKHTEGWVRKLLRKHREKKVFRSADTAGIFEWIYQTNKWGDPESVSGSGSNLAQTARIRVELPGLLARHGVRTLLDAPCGDFYWMQRVELEIDSYIGADIVQDLIDRNNQTHRRSGRQFIRLDLLEDALPEADLLLCRDCLVHLDFERIERFIANLKRSSIPLLLTTTHLKHGENADKLTGQHRFLNLQKPPFNWPEPLELIAEDVVSAKRDSGKALALWRVESLYSWSSTSRPGPCTG